MYKDTRYLYIAGLAIIIVLVLNYLSVENQIRNSQDYCEVDSDCSTVFGCCGNVAGSINKNYIDAWNKENSDCSNVICTLRREFAYETKCENSKCQIIEKQSSAIRIDETSISPNTIRIINIGASRLPVTDIKVLVNTELRNCTWSLSEIYPSSADFCTFDGAPCTSGQEIYVSTTINNDKTWC